MGKMWVEAIRVRSSATALEKAATALNNEVKKINELVSVEKAFIMQHAKYDGDLIVFMLWNNEVKPDKTREGLMIAERLQELGTIDHAVWIPAKKIGVLESE